VRPLEPRTWVYLFVQVRSIPRAVRSVHARARRVRASMPRGPPGPRETVAGAYGLSQRYLLPALRLAHAASNILTALDVGDA
jgi:hypothetical protein